MAREDYEAFEEKFKKHHSDGPRRKLILGAVTAVIVAGVILERRRIDHAVTEAQDELLMQMYSLFEGGWLAGFNFARENIKDFTNVMTPLSEIHNLPR